MLAKAVYGLPTMTGTVRLIADAPKPTSRKPSASICVTDDSGAVLLLRRTDNGRWTIPTGG